jgi:transcriptional regulator with XRE-family HTH domain
MAVNIEDAGFEIRDMIAWVYGSGFPKSLNIGKAVDKTGGKSVAWFGEWLRKWRKENNITQKEVAKLFPSKTGGLTGCVANWELGLNVPTLEQFNLICKTFNLPFESIEELERELSGIDERYNEPSGIVNVGQGERTKIQRKVTKGNSEWEGWGTALKPALEPITVARKPISEKSIAENVLRWGTGGINIDESRVGTEQTRTTIKDLSQAHGNQFGKAGIKYPTQGYKENPPGRFPANFIHDGSPEVLELFPTQGEKSEARFFYCAKASKKDRNEGLDGFEDKLQANAKYRPSHLEKALEGDSGKPHGRYTPTKNNHPTVKPTELMLYLIKLVTKPEGITLDPFMGSGSTGKAAARGNFKFIGIEREQDFYEIAQARINHETSKPKQQTFDF